LSIILDSEKPEKIANMKYEDQVIVTIYSPPQQGRARSSYGQGPMAKKICRGQIN
jgi:hypothetical protein